MTSADFDFDAANSDLRIGIELEYPGLGDGDKRFASRGRDTSSLQNEMPRHAPPDGDAVYDGTVGLEIVSHTMDLEHAESWYRDNIAFVEEEWGVEHQPVGLMRRGATAGLHLHLSDLSYDKAQDLYDISQTPWAKVLFCSAIATTDDAVSWPVFRGGRHCRMNFDGSRYACVNSRGGGHYEWRLPEPMVPEHMEIVVNFLSIFEEDTEEAIRYAQEVLDQADDRITSVTRAEAVGIDIEEMPSVYRSMADSDPEGFYEEVVSSWSAPEIYHVEYGDESFYAFDSRLDDEVVVNDVAFHPDDVLRADSLEPSTDEEAIHTIETALERRNSEEQRTTEATEELKKIVKKKKK